MKDYSEIIEQFTTGLSQDDLAADAAELPEASIEEIASTPPVDDQPAAAATVGHQSPMPEPPAGEVVKAEELPEQSADQPLPDTAPLESPESAAVPQVSELEAFMAAPVPASEAMGAPPGGSLPETEAMPESELQEFLAPLPLPDWAAAELSQVQPMPARSPAQLASVSAMGSPQSSRGETRELESDLPQRDWNFDWPSEAPERDMESSLAEIRGDMQRQFESLRDELDVRFRV